MPIPFCITPKTGMMKLILVLGRFFYSLIFLLTIRTHFSPGTIQYVAATGLPYASFLVPASGILAVLGALSILLGFKARLGAWLLVFFLIPVTLVMHHFWTYTDPSQVQMQEVNFMKNLSLLGAAFLIAYFGSGPVSLTNDQWGKKQDTEPRQTK